MSEQGTAVPSGGAPDQGAGAAGPGKPEPPLTTGQKIFLVVLYLYVASLVWLVLSHHWYGVLPYWLDPH